MIKLDLIEYSNLPTGETRNGECPTCGKHKFYVTRKNEGLAYICHRASCPTQGFIGDYKIVSNETNAVKPRKNYEWTGNMFDACMDLDGDYFKSRFGITFDTQHDMAYWIKVSGDSRYVFPLWGSDDKLRGHVVRRATWQGIPEPLMQDSYDEDFPKALTYIHPDEPRCGWYHSQIESTVVIVEDCVSAMRIACMGYTAVALLGTTLQPNVLGELLSWNGKRYILALDPDAQFKANYIGLRYGGAFPNGLQVAQLDCDPKDYTLDEDLIHALGL